MIKCYKYRLYPNKMPESKLYFFSGCRRYVWNWALNLKLEYYKETGKNLSYNELSKKLTLHKKEATFLQESSSQPLQQVLRDLDSAYSKFFSKKARFPKFKSRKTCQPAFRFAQQTHIFEDKVSLPKIGIIKASVDRLPAGIIKSATVKQDSCQHWFITFVVHEEPQTFELSSKNPVGIDVGLTSFLTLSSGEKVDTPKFYRKAQKKLKKAQQALSRCKNFSNRRKKVKLRVARLHSKIANKRNDFLHKLSLTLVKTYDTICVEALNLKGLVKTKLSKSFTDVSFGMFFNMLEYKSSWYGSRLIKVDRWYPSSKTCHVCLQKTQLSLSDRVWTCACGTTHDRDVNAALNILTEGLRSLGSSDSRENISLE